MNLTSFGTINKLILPDFYGLEAEIKIKVQTNEDGSERQKPRR